MPPRRAPASAPGAPTHSVTSRWRVFFLVWAAASVLTSLWVFATPIGASPDEPAHIVKAAAVAHGEFTGIPDEGTYIVQVPQYVAWTHAQTCSAFNHDVPADCSLPVPEPADALVSSTTTAGLYNPVYYLIVGWPSLVFHDHTGIYAMRLVSAVLTSLFLAVSALLISTWRRPALPLAALGIITTPMLLFLGASVNPNAVETTATVAVLTAMLSILLSDRRDLLSERAVLLVVSALLAVNARGLSPLWLAVVVLIPLFLVPWSRTVELLRLRPVILAIVGVGVATGFALIWTLTSNSLGAAVTDPDGQIFPGAGTPAIYGFLWSLERTPDFFGHMIGLFGWMDTPAPFFVTAVWITAILALIVAALAVLRGRALAVTIAMLAASVLLPAIIQGAYVTDGGYIWQGRYNMPLTMAALLTAAALLASRLPVGSRPVRRVWMMAAALLGTAQLYALAVVLRRHSVGLDATWIDLLTRPQWSPPGGVALTLALAALAIGVVTWFAARAVLRVEAHTQGLPAVTEPTPSL